MDTEVTTAAIRWVPAVEWHDGINNEPSLERLYDVTCPKFYEDEVFISDKYFAPLKAFTHIVTQRPRELQGRGRDGLAMFIRLMRLCDTLQERLETGFGRRHLLCNF